MQESDEVEIEQDEEEPELEAEIEPITEEEGEEPAAIIEEPPEEPQELESVQDKPSKPVKHRERKPMFKDGRTLNDCGPFESLHSNEIGEIGSGAKWIRVPLTGEPDPTKVELAQKSKVYDHEFALQEQQIRVKWPRKGQ